MGQLERTRFLLDANLSSQIGRFLAKRHSLDIKSLLAEGLGDVDDQFVVSLARDEDRVIITLDRDFHKLFFSRAESLKMGVVFLDLPNNARKIANVGRVLDNFFTRDAPLIEFKKSLVVVTDRDVLVHRAPQQS